MEGRTEAASSKFMPGICRDGCRVQGLGQGDLGVPFGITWRTLLKIIASATNKFKPGTLSLKPSLHVPIVGFLVHWQVRISFSNWGAVIDAKSLVENGFQDSFISLGSAGCLVSLA